MKYSMENWGAITGKDNQKKLLGSVSRKSESEMITAVGNMEASIRICKMVFLRRLIRFTVHWKMGALFPCRRIGVAPNIGA